MVEKGQKEIKILQSMLRQDNENELAEFLDGCWVSLLNSGEYGTYMGCYQTDYIIRGTSQKIKNLDSILKKKEKKEVMLKNIHLIHPIGENNLEINYIVCQVDPKLIENEKVGKKKSKKKNLQEDQIGKDDVFIVHGRNLEMKSAISDFLSSLNISTLEWEDCVRATGEPSPYVGDVLEKAFELTKVVIILLTPDDCAKLKEEFWKDKEEPFETKLTGQARPNVLFEAGIAMGIMKKRTIIIEIGDLRPYSDIVGRNVVRLDNKEPSRKRLIERLKTAGLNIKIGKKTKWKSIGNFELKSDLNCYLEENVKNDETEKQKDIKDAQNKQNIQEILQKIYDSTSSNKFGDIYYTLKTLQEKTYWEILKILQLRIETKTGMDLELVSANFNLYFGKKGNFLRDIKLGVNYFQDSSQNPQVKENFLKYLIDSSKEHNISLNRFNSKQSNHMKSSHSTDLTFQSQNTSILSSSVKLNKYIEKLEKLLSLVTQKSQNYFDNEIIDLMKFIQLNQINYMNYLDCNIEINKKYFEYVGSYENEEDSLIVGEKNLVVISFFRGIYIFKIVLNKKGQTSGSSTLFFYFLDKNQEIKDRTKINQHIKIILKRLSFIREKEENPDKYAELRHAIQEIYDNMKKLRLSDNISEKVQIIQNIYNFQEFFPLLEIKVKKGSYNELGFMIDNYKICSSKPKYLDNLEKKPYFVIEEARELFANKMEKYGFLIRKD